MRTEKEEFGLLDEMTNLMNEVGKSLGFQNQASFLLICNSKASAK